MLRPYKFIKFEFKITARESYVEVETVKRTGDKRTGDGPLAGFYLGFFQKRRIFERFVVMSN